MKLSDQLVEKQQSHKQNNILIIPKSARQSDHTQTGLRP